MGIRRGSAATRQVCQRIRPICKGGIAYKVRYHTASQVLQSQGLPQDYPASYSPEPLQHGQTGNEQLTAEIDVRPEIAKTGLT